MFKFFEYHEFYIAGNSCYKYLVKNMEHVANILEV